MRFAAIETSTEWCSVALWRDGEIAAIERRAANRHSELVLPMLERLAGKAGMTLAQLDAVAFGAGPGSFTGLRVACGLAQGLAFARALPVIGISTLEAIAEASGAPRPPGQDWVGCGNGFAVYGDMGLKRILAEIHPGAVAVAQLAAPRLAAGEGVDAAAAAPIYVRDKVAFTRQELGAR